jgi:hypothetical protein
MAEDNSNVQGNEENVQEKEEPTSTEEQVPQGEEEKAPPEPSVDEKIAAMIQTAKDEVAKEIAKVTESARREIQSAKDKSRAEVEAAQRKAKTAEISAGAAQKYLRENDPEAAEKLELTMLRAKDENRQVSDEEAAIKVQQEAYTKALQDSLNSHLTDLGIDLNDPRIDWAKDASDFVSGRTRFDVSVAKIIKENMQTAQSGLEKRLSELEKKAKEEDTEANSVETGTSGGVPKGSDQQFIKDFGSGKLPMTKENVEKYNKIKDSYE